MTDGWRAQHKCVGVFFPTELHRRLKRSAAQQDLSISQLIRKAVRLMVETHEGVTRGEERDVEKVNN